MSPRDFFQLAVVSVLMISLGCAAASTPAPTPPAGPSSPSLQVGDTTVVALSPAPAACCKKQTLPQFLGLDQLAGGILKGLRGLGARLSARLDLAGRFPALQDPPPPVLAITDPANLSPDAPPAVAAAAEVKAEEDAAAQKVQALKYLATIGCGGCYPSVEDALLAALDDCTEMVRYEAAMALRGSDASCRYCSSGACCSNAVKQKLQKIAHETDETGCPLEPSERVRREARLALAACGGTVEALTVPEEGPELPTPAVREEVASSSSLYETIQLASFSEAASLNLMEDIVLAQVNGQPIFESQVAAIVKSKFEKEGLNYEAIVGHERYRTEIRVQLVRLIESRLLEQAARTDLGLDQDPSPSQVANWLDSALAVYTDVHPAEVASMYELDHANYNVPAKVRWERITVAHQQLPNREKAHEVISYLRHRATGAAVQPMPGFKPSMVEHQTHSWSTRSQVSSALIADLLSRLPVGQLSPIVEDQQAFHLVRVLERSASRRISLADATDDIRTKIIERRRAKAGQELLKHLHRSATIWTAFQPSPNLDRRRGQTAAAATNDRLVLPAQSVVKEASPIADSRIATQSDSTRTVSPASLTIQSSEAASKERFKSATDKRKGSAIALDTSAETITTLSDTSHMDRAATRPSVSEFRMSRLPPP